MHFVYFLLVVISTAAQQSTHRAENADNYYNKGGGGRRRRFLVIVIPRYPTPPSLEILGFFHKASLNKKHPRCADAGCSLSALG